MKTTNTPILVRIENIDEDFAGTSASFALALDGFTLPNID